MDVQKDLILTEVGLSWFYIMLHAKSIKMNFITEILYLNNVLSLTIDGFLCTKHGH